MTSALLLIDMQNDFVLPSGSLSVRGAEEIIPIVNTLRSKFQNVVITQDWHPSDHVSFYTNHPGHKPLDVVQIGQIHQMLFNPHCIAESHGAEICKGIVLDPEDMIIHKGAFSDIDSYSCFFDVAKIHSTDAHELLQARGVQKLFVLGVATDFCVKASVIDACKLGYTVYVISDGIRAVDPSAVEASIQEMKENGAIIIESNQVANYLRPI